MYSVWAWTCRSSSTWAISPWAPAAARQHQQDPALLDGGALARRLELLRHLDWSTLVFFASLFVLMEAVWHSGALQPLLPAEGWTRSGLLLAGVGISQLISNVPLVALLLPVLEQTGASVPDYLALAAGATLAGNLLLFGAASNIIIVQQAEREGLHLGFGEFARTGIPVTLLQLLCFQGWFAWLH